MDLGLAKKRALVTGGTRGIGRAIADLLADEGADVAICARNATEVNATVKALWCTNGLVAASLRRVGGQRIRAEAGMPILVIRFSTLHPIFASVRCVGRVRA